MKDLIILKKLGLKRKICQKVLQIQLYQDKWLKHQVLLVLLEDRDRQ